MLWRKLPKYALVDGKPVLSHYSYWFLIKCPGCGRTNRFVSKQLDFQWRCECGHTEHYDDVLG